MAKDMSGLLDSFESETTVKHEKAVGTAVGRKKKGTRATFLVSMTDKEKARLTEKAQEHGLSLSAFFRLAADEYIRNHDW